MGRVWWWEDGGGYWDGECVGVREWGGVVGRVCEDGVSVRGGVLSGGLGLGVCWCITISGYVSLCETKRATFSLNPIYDIAKRQLLELSLMTSSCQDANGSGVM